MKQIVRALLCVSLLLPTGYAKAKNDITIAMTAAFVSENGIGIYEKITQYIANKTGLSTEFVYGLSYTTVNKMLEAGAVDIAFVCGYPYVLSQGKDQSISLIAAPVMSHKRYNNQPIYYSYIIVPLSSQAQSLEDLRGKHFVFNDSTSNSGYNMPRAKLIEMNETDGFFSQVSQSGSHEESIRMVAEGKADVSAIDSLVLDYERFTSVPYANRVRIIETLGPAGVPPVVRSHKTSDSVAQKVQQALINMQNDPQGAQILEKALLKSFIKIDDVQYDSIRAMHQLAKDNQFMSIK